MTTRKQKHNPTAKSESLKASTTNQIALISIIIAALTAFPLWRWYKQYEQKQKLLSIVSSLDFKGVEPQVQNKILDVKNLVMANPGSADAWGKLAMNLDVHDFKKEAVSSYKEAATLDSSNFRWPYFCALVLFQGGDGHSLDWFERALNARSDYPPMLTNYGDALLRFDRREDATEKYQQALHFDPRNSHALLGLARISRANADLPSSRANLEKAIAVNPYHGEAYHLLATVCRQQQDANCADRATAAARDLQEKTPLADPIYMELTSEGVSALWYSYRGSEYLKQGKYDAAISELQQALALRSDTQTQEDLAKAYIAAGKYADAERQYRSVVATHPTPNNYFGLALANAQLGSYDTAEDFFRKAIQQKQDFAEAYFNLAVIFAKRGRLQETLQNLSEAIRIKPDYAEAHYHMGLAYLAGMDISSAKNQYSILTKLDQSLAEKLQRSIAMSEISKPGTE